MIRVGQQETRAVLRLVWPSIRLLFIERWRHLADSNEPNFINKFFKHLIGSLHGSPPKFDTLLASLYPTYMHSLAEQYGDMYSDEHKTILNFLKM